MEVKANANITRAILKNNKKVNDGLKTVRVILESLSDLDLGKFINELESSTPLPQEQREVPTEGEMRKELAMRKKRYLKTFSIHEVDQYLIGFQSCWNWMRDRPTGKEEKIKTINDGCGSEWALKCAECGKDTMQVVRPGKAQCSKCG